MVKRLYSYFVSKSGKLKGKNKEYVKICIPVAHEVLAFNAITPI